MRKSFRALFVFVLIMGMTGTSFAAQSSPSSDIPPVITSTETDHLIDDSVLVQILNAENDPEKRALLTKIFYFPVTLTISTSPVETSKMLPETIVSLNEDQIQRAEWLARLDMDALRFEFDKMISQNVEKIIYTENVFATKALQEYLLEVGSEEALLIQDKVFDGNAEEIININEREETNFGFPQFAAAQSIISKSYYKRLTYDSLFSVVLWMSVSVNWQYDSITDQIVSLIPNTDSGYINSPVGPHILGGWMKDTQFITSPSSGDRGFVQKAREILTTSGGNTSRLAMFRFNLVFSASANNAAKMLLEDVGVFPSVGTYDPTNWGGGY